MCLGIPGKLVEVFQRDSLPMGKVEFGGILKEVCLAYTPEAAVGQYVLVHVGFAISQIDAAEAEEIFTYLKQIDELSQSDGDGAGHGSPDAVADAARWADRPQRVVAGTQRGSSDPAEAPAAINPVREDVR